jgi:penicillin amidase
VIPYDDLPQVYNPPSGIVISANQNPFPADYKYPVAGVFAPPYRAQQIRALLASQPKWSAPEMRRIQTDVYSPPLHFLAGEAVKAWEKNPATNAQSREAIDALRNWNGQMEPGGPAPVVANFLYEQLREAAAKRASPDADDEYNARLAPSVIERLLRERPPDWFPNYDELLVNSLAAAIDQGGRLLGSSVPRWNWGAYSRVEIQHPVFKGIPLVGRYFNIGPLPMSGSPYSVKQVTQRLGPSFRMIVDFSDLDASLANITTGQSGQIFSPHYKDQWDAYYNGTGLPMRFRNVSATETLTVLP